MAEAKMTGSSTRLFIIKLFLKAVVKADKPDRKTMRYSLIGLSSGQSSERNEETGSPSVLNKSPSEAFSNA